MVKGIQNDEKGRRAGNGGERKEYNERGKEEISEGQGNKGI